MGAAAVKRTTRSLRELLDGMARLADADNRLPCGLTADSRAVKPGDLFVACRGASGRGHEFIAAAVGKGAVAVVYDSGAESTLGECRGLAARHGVPLVAVTAVNERLGEIAARFYHRPSEDLEVVAVTGTNGKTSCSQFLAQGLSAEGMPCGVIGTLGYGPYGRLAVGTLTTPDAVTVQAILAELRAAGARHAVLEASSHGLQQGRLNGVAVDVALFTNLTHDHLDYHGDMARYGEAKLRLFRDTRLSAAVLNGDDAFGGEILRHVPAGVEVLAYCLVEHGERPAWTPPRQVTVIRGGHLRLDRAGLAMEIETPWGAGTLRAPLLGRFNASNLLGVLAVMLAMGMTPEEALRRMGALRTVPGRMERFGGAAGQPLVVVDYAHTPDALQQALTSLRGHVPGELWCVFGCGGERDRTKRPRMGAIAEHFADRVVVTDDNPRGEQGRAIVRDILGGMSRPGEALVIDDRAAAIAYAVGHAGEADAVLVAGKGHEEYQIIGTDKRPFSDRQVVRGVLGGAA